MSSSLTWIPVISRKEKDIPTALKIALKRRFDFSRGPLVLELSARMYIEGLADAQVEGAKDLLAALDKHGCIEIKETF